MRLRTSKASAEDRLASLLTQGYQLRQQLGFDYNQKDAEKSFDPESDNKRYGAMVNEWEDQVCGMLDEIFPTSLEAHFFSDQEGGAGISYAVNQRFGKVYFEELPSLLSRLREILYSYLGKYTDLPLQERLYVEDIDSFSKVRDINPACVAHLLSDGRIELSEDAVQLALEQILDVPFHRKDWGGEICDLYTANVIVNGARTETAFLLKGKGLRRREMQIADCGKNGDQLGRLSRAPARLFVVQYVGVISEAVISDMEGKVREKRSTGFDSHVLIVDGQDTARLLYAYGKLSG